MLIGYKDDENDTHTSTHASSIDIQPSSENVTRLVLAIGKEEFSVKSMMEAIGLKNLPLTSTMRHPFHIRVYTRPDFQVFNLCLGRSEYRKAA